MEHIQSYIGNAICDGGAIMWEHKAAFEGIPQGELQKMSIEELEQTELQRMEYNAFKVCSEVSARIDRAYVSLTAVQLFFSDHEYFQTTLHYPNLEKMAPGGVYYRKIEMFADHHVKRGAKYMEFLKFSCIRSVANQIP